MVVRDANGAKLGVVTDMQSAVTVVTPKGYLVQFGWDGQFTDQTNGTEFEFTTPDCTGTPYLSFSPQYQYAKKVFSVSSPQISGRWGYALGQDGQPTTSRPTLNSWYMSDGNGTYSCQASSPFTDTVAATVQLSNSDLGLPAGIAGPLTLAGY